VTAGQRRVVVTLRRDGSVAAHTEGVAGPACLDLIPLLEDLLGGEVVDSAVTAEYTRTAAAVQERAGETLTEQARLEDRT
jgi:hypothetical protein